MNSIKEISVAARFDNPGHRSISYICQVKTEPLYWFESNHILDIEIPLIDVYESRSYDLEGQIFRRSIESLPDEDFSPCWCPI